MAEHDIADEQTPEQNAAAATETPETESDGTEIRETDIVFDCPHCGHSLAIDYRGAGLQITCSECGEPVLVPIPDGMKIDDLDVEPGEILKQLFAARRNLQKSERRIEELEQELGKMTIRRDTLQAMLEFTKVQIGELKTLLRKQAEFGQKTIANLERIESDLGADMADEAEFAHEGEDGEAAE